MTNCLGDKCDSNGGLSSIFLTNVVLPDFRVPIISTDIFIVNFQS